MYNTRMKRRLRLAAPILTASLLLAACGGDGDAGKNDDAAGGSGAATTSADAGAGASQETSKPAEKPKGPPAEQDADGIELSITDARPSEALPNGATIGVSWSVQPDASGTCDFMLTVYDQTGETLTATPGTACQSKIELNLMGYDVKEFTVALKAGDKMAVRKKAVEG
ncbi:hypothetical protein ACFORJ_10355 [Corynebacterium hansenii]|uniref:Secreted protein n=1 Tax=Corynebacterium hansenii TaxID=394964 RepID=A0ABV7ZT16_9CORY|nr:hypothetical protein [Corynebacterium hansenii]WJZ01156.1 hypothetical protein CHAN_12860 [Corynebacterium hansenii]